MCCDMYPYALKHSVPLLKYRVQILCSVVWFYVSEIYVVGWFGLVDFMPNPCHFILVKNAVCL